MTTVHFFEPAQRTIHHVLGELQYVEECIPEDTLDLGVNVMVMQVQCKAPGCVPLETAIIIIFPSSAEELLPGLPESKGGSYKTKVLKPMAEVKKQDVLEALPPAFPGGLRSMEKLCLQARDIMLGQITQLFDDADVEGRGLMAEYLQQSLQTYIERGCQPREWGKPFDDDVDERKEKIQTGKQGGQAVAAVVSNDNVDATTTADATQVVSLVAFRLEELLHSFTLKLPERHFFLTRSPIIALVLLCFTNNLNRAVQNNRQHCDSSTNIEHDTTIDTTEQISISAVIRDDNGGGDANIISHRQRQHLLQQQYHSKTQLQCWCRTSRCQRPCEFFLWSKATT